MKTLSEYSRITVPVIREAKSQSKIVAVTAYDYVTALLADQAGMDCVLVGDSLASVIQGLETTLPVTLDQIIYHCTCVRRGVKRALVVGDMPFMTYQGSLYKAIEAAGRILKESGASAVKVEGGVHIARVIRRMVQIDIPVMGHVGLTPQSFHRMGGHKIQGKTSVSQDLAGSRERILADARAVEDAGAFAIVIEGVPAELGEEITKSVSIPTIGISAGNACDGQNTLHSEPSFMMHCRSMQPMCAGNNKKFE
jgi:3-methyl-2-oxobutanoate hydroxymethyltransferase